MRIIVSDTRPFRAKQFTATKFSSAEHKDRVGNNLVKFILSGLDASKFIKALYTELSLHFFGHIAHYNREGFCQEWFSDPVTKLAWVDNALSSDCYGHPTHTWCDVELALQEWMIENRIRSFFEADAAAYQDTKNFQVAKAAIEALSPARCQQILANVCKEQHN